MSDLQAYYDNFATQPSRWCDRDESKCGCKGSGYFLSELDTWHECPAHFVEGQRHPEDDSEDPVADAVASLLCFFYRLHPITFKVDTANDDDIPF